MQSVLFHAKFQSASHCFSKQLLNVMLNPCFSPNLPLWNVADLAELYKHMEKQQQVSNMGNLCTTFELFASGLF